MPALSLDIPWMGWPEVARIVKLFEAEGVGLCVFGGAVRNAVLGAPPADFDTIVASNHAATIDLLKRAGLPVTVLDESTVRTQLGAWQFDFLIINHAKERVLPTFEQAARARVAYVDFTLNGFCWFPPGPATAEVKNARSDLALGRLCFVDDPDKRINERIVYILRFFRLHAWYGKAAPEARSLEACVRRAEETLKLKREFVRREMIKFMSAPHPLKALELMRAHDVVKYAVGFPVNDFSLLETLEQVEALTSEKSPWHVRLLLLLLRAPMPVEQALDYVCRFWELDEENRNTLAHMLDYFAGMDTGMPEKALEALAKEMGTPQVRNMLLMRWAMEDDIGASSENYRRLLAGITG